MRKHIVKTENMLVLHDEEYPVTFYIIATGRLNLYFRILEDPFEYGETKIRTGEEVVELCRKFDPEFQAHELPEAVKL